MFDMAFYAVQTVSGREGGVIEEFGGLGDDSIHAALAPDEMSGYVIIEADGFDAVDRHVPNVPNAQKALPGETDFAEVEDFLAPGSDVDDIVEGSRVQVTEGAYAGEVARVKRVNPNDEKVTIELEEATVPVPVSVPGRHVRVLD